MATSARARLARLRVRAMAWCLGRKPKLRSPLDFPCSSLSRRFASCDCSLRLHTGPSVRGVSLVPFYELATYGPATTRATYHTCELPVGFHRTAPPLVSTCFAPLAAQHKGQQGQQCTATPY